VSSRDSSFVTTGEAPAIKKMRRSPTDATEDRVELYSEFYGRVDVFTG